MSPHAFAAWFTGTVLVTRLALWIRSTSSPTVAGFRLHHWMFGLAIAFAAACLSRDSPIARTSRYVAAMGAVGLALFADEITFLLIGCRTHACNYSVESLASTAAVVVCTCACLIPAIERWLLAPEESFHSRAGACATCGRES